MPPRKKVKKVKKVAAKKTVKKTAKPAAKKKTAAKAATKKKAAVKKALPTTAIKAAMNKSQSMTHISDTTGLSKKEVASVFDALSNLMHRHLKKNAAGEFTLPGLMKCSVKRKPATKARKGVNPFTGEEMMVAARPASKKPRWSFPKSLKETFANKKNW